MTDLYDDLLSIQFPAITYTIAGLSYTKLKEYTYIFS